MSDCWSHHSSRHKASQSCGSSPPLEIFFTPPPPPPPLKLFIWGGVACNPKNGPERDLVPGRYSRLRSLPRGGGESLSLIQALPDRFLFPDLSLICRVGFSDVDKRMGAAS